MSTLPPGTRIPMDEPMEPEELAYHSVLDDCCDAVTHMTAAGFDTETQIAILEGAREGARDMLSARDSGYWRGLVEGGVLGIIMGSVVTACALALAWSHMGG